MELVILLICVCAISCTFIVSSTIDTWVRKHYEDNKQERLHELRLAREERVGSLKLQEDLEKDV